MIKIHYIVGVMYPAVTTGMTFFDFLDIFLYLSSVSSIALKVVLLVSEVMPSARSFSVVNIFIGHVRIVTCIIVRSQISIYEKKNSCKYRGILLQSTPLP